MVPVLFVIVAVVGVYFIFAGSQENEVAEENINAGIAEQAPAIIGGEVVYAEGAVEYKTEGGEWTRAETGTALTEGDSIEVLESGRAIVNLDDGSVLRLNAESGITLTSMDPEAMVVTNDGGEVYSRVVEAERTFEMMAGSVTYESLGTAYNTVNLEGKKGVEVFHSSVKAITDGEETLVEEGKKWYAENTDDPDNEKIVTDIADEDLEKEFINWNKEEDSKNFKEKLGVFEKEEIEEKAPAEETEEPVEEVKEETEEPAVDNEPLSGDIALAYNMNGNVSWTTDLNSPDGFKLVWSKNEGPTYPTRDGDMYKYYSDPAARAGAVYFFDGGGTYYIRVCTYENGACGVYSNTVTATFYGEEEKEEVKEEPKEETEEKPKEEKKEEPISSVNSISLSGSGANVSWTVDGTSAKGFKVVWSKTDGPTYPCRSGDKYQYLSDPSASSTSLTAFDGSGTYYVRVCEYLGGACGVYSNQITVELTK